MSTCTVAFAIGFFIGACIGIVLTFATVSFVLGRVLPPSPEEELTALD